MKPASFTYFAPTSIDEAIGLLAADDQARPLAGGQSLVPMMNLRLARPTALVDLNRIPELQCVVEDQGGLTIGAMTRQAALLRHPLVGRGAPLLVEALSFVGHPPTRARGTIGGSLSNADPAAELPAAILALDAELILRGTAGERRVKAEEFFVGMFETLLGPAELLTSIRIPLARKRDVGAFVEVSRRHGDFAVVSVAANLSMPDGTICDSARIVLGGATPAPVRCRAVEQLLAGHELSDRVIADCGDAIDAAMIEMESYGAGKAYRLHAARVLLRRALETIRRRAGVTS